MYSELSIPPSNAIESSCAAAPNDWEERMARQTLASDDVIRESMQNNQSSDREVLKVWITAADIVVLNRIDLQGAVTVLLTKEFKGTGSDYLRPVTLDSLKQLLGLVVFGTFRFTTGKEVLKSGLASQIHRIQPNHAKSITTSRAQVRFSGTPNMM
jgi:G3E family GTPase